MENLIGNLEKLTINDKDEELLHYLNQNIHKIKVSELKMIAKEEEIPHTSRMNKKELIIAIKSHILLRKYYYKSFAKFRNLRRYNIDRLFVNVPRFLIQGGMNNEDFGKNIYDWRLQHHFPTMYTCKWKNFKNVDQKFYDIENEKGEKAEGKKMTGGITLTPSRDTGAEREFCEENLGKCLKTNDYYFFYDRKVEEETITFIIIWVDIKTVIEWYNTYGNKKGYIPEKNLQYLFDNRCTFNDETVKIK